MNHMLRVQGWMTARLVAGEHDRDRGDVPGWVMVTVMSALLVVALLFAFRTQLVQIVQDAFSSIK